MASCFHALIKNAYSSWLLVWNDNYKSHIWTISLLNFPSWIKDFIYSSTYHDGFVSWNDCWLSRKKIQDKTMLVIVRKTFNKQITKLLIWGSLGTYYLTYPLLRRSSLYRIWCCRLSYLSINHHEITAQEKGIKISVQECHCVVDHFWRKIKRRPTTPNFTQTWPFRGYIQLQMTNLFFIN